MKVDLIPQVDPGKVRTHRFRDYALRFLFGAVLGAIAMVAFAVVVSLAVTSWGTVPSLVVALIVWLGVAFGLYFLVATVYGREPAPP